MGLTKAQKAEREQAQKRSEATKRGWETKRANAKKTASQFTGSTAPDIKGKFTTGTSSPYTIGTIKWEQKGDNSNDPIKVFAPKASGDIGYEEEAKPGHITTQAEQNESLSRMLNSAISRLYSNMSEKIGGSLDNDSNKELKESSLRILGALQATEANLNGSFRMIEELHKLQEEML